MFGLSTLTSSCGGTLLNAFKVSTGALSAAFITPVRYRYYADRPEITVRRWGYKDKMERSGLLPRVPYGFKYPLPDYVPSNPWSEKHALFGQNDYIDILGDDEHLLPHKFAYGVPGWLRGFKGGEYQTLLRKRYFFGAQIRSAYPRTHLFIAKRLKFLYRRINYKTKSFMDSKTMRR